MKQAFKLLVLSLLLPVGMLSAQKYSVEASFLSPKQSGTGLSDTYFMGGRVGALVEIDMKYNFSIVSGALYSMVYSNKLQKYAAAADSITYTTYGHSIDIPIRLQYSLPIGKEFRFFAFAGPNVNVGLAMPQKITSLLTDDKAAWLRSELGDNMADWLGLESVAYANNDLYKEDKIRRINLQLGAGGGIQWRNYQIKGGYDFGLNSIYKGDNKNKKLHTSGWTASLVYQF